MTLLFASSNLNKLSEIRSIPELKKFNIISLEQAGIREEIPETSPTILENAIQKARWVYQNYQLNCFADDTGLEIEALYGRPGVYSARYAGEPPDPLKNIEKVLRELGEKPNRKTRFLTVIALIIDGKEYVFEGIVNGIIITEPRGNNGFGYDPIFIPEGDTRTFAEMSMEEKNSISHRGRAIRKLAEFFGGKGPKSGDGSQK